MRALELTIEDVAFGGKGVARDNGKAVFIPFTIDSERVAARVIRDKKQFAEAEPIRIIESSPERVSPPCPYFGRCGGCSYQHISYEHQLRLKTRQVEQALRRIGKFAQVPMRAIIPSPLQYGYRNRITVHVENGTLGFYRHNAHQLIDIAHCPISGDEVNAALAELRANRPRDGHFALRSTPDARVFRQTNDGVAAALLALVERLVPTGDELLIDAYCGAGFFAKGLLAKFDRITGVDWDRFAIEAAQRDASDKETYVAGDVAVHVAKLLVEADPERTTVIVDPPATGLTPEIRDALFEFTPATLIYISCNPPTLARDLAGLRARYKIESVTPLDMFPQTAEIEVAVHLAAMNPRDTA